MVATAGSGWRLAPCLVAMYEEANRLAPNRHRATDGSIGDRAHASRTSDHNPSNGYVHALDLTHAPASGFDAHARARMVVARRDRRIKYVISNGQVARSYDKPGIPAWSWATYTGSNQHTLHAHFSVHEATRDDVSPWWPASTPSPVPPVPEDIDMVTFDAHAWVERCYAVSSKHTINDLAGIAWNALRIVDADDPMAECKAVLRDLGLPTK